MFEEFDQYIKEFEIEDFAVDYWYDEGVLIAGDMLRRFINNDWESLIQALPKRTIGWKRRLAYCLDDSSDLRQLEIIILLIDTDDTELFVLSLDALRCFKNNQVIMKNNGQIIDKIESLMPTVGVATQKIFQEYLRECGRKDEILESKL